MPMMVSMVSWATIFCAKLHADVVSDCGADGHAGIIFDDEACSPVAKLPRTCSMDCWAALVIEKLSAKLLAETATDECSRCRGHGSKPSMICCRDRWASLLFAKLHAKVLTDELTEERDGRDCDGGGLPSPVLPLPKPPMTVSMEERTTFCRAMSFAAEATDCDTDETACCVHGGGSPCDVLPNASRTTLCRSRFTPVEDAEAVAHERAVSVMRGGVLAMPLSPRRPVWDPMIVSTECWAIFCTARSASSQSSVICVTVVAIDSLATDCTLRGGTRLRTESLSDPFVSAKEDGLDTVMSQLLWLLSRCRVESLLVGVTPSVPNGGVLPYTVSAPMPLS
mmetsp:Transcript_19604/g.55106  ORF Transcript_19604/g.55106 Transcript_19604/m.55106 type:complete len:338 (+) Transcript_19604:648-1661(+)